MKPFTAHMHAITLRLALSGAAGYIQCDMGEGAGQIGWGRGASSAYALEKIWQHFGVFFILYILVKQGFLD